MHAHIHTRHTSIVILLTLCLQAYNTDEKSQKKHFRSISIVMNVISYVAVTVVAVVVPVVITQASASNSRP